MRKLLLVLVLAGGLVLTHTVVAQELLPPEPEEESEPEQTEEELTLAERIDALIEQLHAKDTADRDSAVKELVRIGEPVIEAVIGLLESEDADIRFHAKKILDELHYVTEEDR